MQELFLHYVWQFQYFDKSALQTTEGEDVTVFHTGFRNTNAGPDFLNARIKIGNIEWIGHVEIHINASGWNDHKHDQDAAYDNVILHVVWKDDSKVLRKDQTLLPTITLQGKVQDSLLLKYNGLVLNPDTIPCSSTIKNIHELTRLSMLDRTVSSRLESKAEDVRKILVRNNGDWEETCYQLIARNFGFRVNADPFFSLAKSLPYKYILKHADHPLQVEALLFGQSGLLEEAPPDEYVSALRREHVLLSKKFDLASSRMNKSQWRFLRLRPANFPTVRIAQFASLLIANKNIFSRILAAVSYKDLYPMFKISQSEYWQHHYLFGKYIDEKISGVGQSSVDNVIINSVVPLLAAYAIEKDDNNFMERAVTILQHVSAEENMIIKQWRSLGVESRSAFDTQGLIELHNNFCVRKRCLDCNIGASLVRPLLT